MAGFACIALVALMAPRMARVEWIRTLTPWADEPPYSPYEFTVTPGDTQVLYAGTVDVRSEFGKVKPEQLEMLVETEGAPAEVLPMFPEADGAWRGQLRELTAPVRYTVRTRDGRTRAFRVALIYTPEFEKVTFRVTPPAYTGLPAQEGPLPEAGLAGLAGTKVEVTV